MIDAHRTFDATAARSVIEEARRVAGFPAVRDLDQKLLKTFEQK